MFALPITADTSTYRTHSGREARPRDASRCPHQKRVPTTAPSSRPSPEQISVNHIFPAPVRTPHMVTLSAIRNHEVVPRARRFVPQKLINGSLTRRRGLRTSGVRHQCVPEFLAPVHRSVIHRRRHKGNGVQLRQRNCGHHFGRAASAAPRKTPSFWYMMEFRSTGRRSDLQEVEHCWPPSPPFPTDTHIRSHCPQVPAIRKPSR